MPLPETFELPAAADFHVHLRDGAMMAVVTKTILPGGVDTVYVMPNLLPPITTVEQAVAYKAKLEALEPDVRYIMTLYLHESITPEVIHQAKASGVVAGVKSYPAGVTTNSASGVLSYEPFYPVFAAMEEEEEGLVLNLHGELPPSQGKDITVMNAEAEFLTVLRGLHARFPKLRIVLEHCTTAAAVQAVRECGDTVAGGITAHHLFLTVDDVVGNVHHFCKPLAKLPSDRRALLDAVVNSEGKFFLGTDSAPHDVAAKERPGEGKAAAAGVFTQANAVGLVLSALDEAVARGDLESGQVTQEAVAGFLGGHGREFYGEEEAVDGGGGDRRPRRRIKLTRDAASVADKVEGEGVTVIPFRRGRVTWKVEWI